MPSKPNESEYWMMFPTAQCISGLSLPQFTMSVVEVQVGEYSRISN